MKMNLNSLIISLGLAVVTVLPTCVAAQTNATLNQNA
jgi:hypothetical protein